MNTGDLFSALSSLMGEMAYNRSFSSGQRRQEWRFTLWNGKQGSPQPKTGVVAAGVGFYRNATLQEITKGIETIVEIVYRLPVLNILFSGAMYIWTLIIALFYCLYKKLGSGIFFLSPLILDAAVILASPRGGIYFRYFLPIAVCLPTAILFSFAVSEITQTEK